VARIAKVAQDRATASSPEGHAVHDNASLTRYVDQHRLAEVPSLYSMDMNNVQAVFPAYPGQTYMLNVWQTSKGQLFYPAFNYRFSAHVTESQLQGAWESMRNLADPAVATLNLVGGDTAKDSFT
jgi:hypothetical protein